MNPKTSKPLVKKNFYEFPNSRDFFLLDFEENIKNFKTTNPKDPEYIYVSAENKEKKIHEKIIKRIDILEDYEIIKVSTLKKDEINFIIPKKNFINAREIRLLAEIKKRPSLMNEIKRKTKINLDTKDNIIFKEIFGVPNSQNFYNRFFTLIIQKQGSNKHPNTQNQFNNNSFTNINNAFINNNPNKNINQIQNNNISNNTNIINNMSNNNNFNNNFNNFGQNNSNTTNNINNLKNIDNNFEQPQNENGGNYSSTQIFYNNFNNQNNNILFNNISNCNYIINNNNNTPSNFNNINNGNNPNNISNNNPIYQNNNSQNPNFQYNNNINLNQINQNFSQNNNNSIRTNEDIEMKDETGNTSFNPMNNILQNGTNNPSSGQFTFQPGQNSSQSNNPQPSQNSSQPFNPQPGPYNFQPGQNPSQPNNSQTGQNPPPPPPPPQQPNYIFPKKGLRNIGSTCYMNATLQCLLHVSELITYFIDEYPRDLNTLIKINSNVQSGGDISRAFYNLINGVYDKPEYLSDSKKNLNLQTNQKKSSWNLFGSWGINNNNNSFAPEEFKRSLGLHNPQFRKFEANDSKDLILYLLQTMHEELNYFGNINKRLKYIPNQYNIFETYNHFISNYNTNNFSKISLLFYGTYINSTICKICKQILYNFQKFEFISFGMFYYNKQKFNIMDGFRDNSKPCQLTGDNKFLCNICKRMQEAETTCKIFEPPQKLLINLDYGKNKKYQPSSIEFDEEIDITKYVAFDCKQQFKYRIIGVCTHYGYSGRYGHYVAFCRHREKNIWYEFNDSSVSECSKRDIYRGSPYLLLYERIF